jgi:superfamily II DNA or RNA helicase
LTDQVVHDHLTGKLTAGVYPLLTDETCWFLDTLFLALPISWRGTLQQYVGRLHRLRDNKREVIVYDYVDDCVPVLTAMYAKRVRGYEAVGYQFKKTSHELPHYKRPRERFACRIGRPAGCYFFKR